MYAISSFYKFLDSSEQHVQDAKARLEHFASEAPLYGLVILATEGINGTISGSPEDIQSAKRLLSELFGEDGWPYKDSSSEQNPFKRFKVRIRREIVTTGAEQAPRVPAQINALTPQEWHKMLKEDEDVVVLDTRNYYETELGTFQGAIDPGLVHFRHFTDYVQRSEIPKDKKVLMYCTGGIRCEKAIYQMQELGYESVFQLQGGILNYLKEYPGGLFEGECFVFDQRVAVTQTLEPSARWRLCPHCGQPGDVEVQCGRCAKHAKLCNRCHEQNGIGSCSKDCENQLQRLQQSA